MRRPNTTILQSAAVKNSPHSRESGRPAHGEVVLALLSVSGWSIVVSSSVLLMAVFVLEALVVLAIHEAQRFGQLFHISAPKTISLQSATVKNRPQLVVSGTPLQKVVVTVLAVVVVVVSAGGVMPLPEAVFAGFAGLAVSEPSVVVKFGLRP